MSALAAAGSIAQLALELLVVKPKRGFTVASNGDSIVAQATIEEMHSDEAEITDHPVEQGATISDHAFARPSEVVITCGWSNSPTVTGPLNQLIGAAANASPAIQAVVGAAEFVGGVINLLNGGQDAITKAYQWLLTVYNTRTLLDVHTGRRPYQNMLIKSLVLTTDHRTENAMLIRVTCRQILMATTQTVLLQNSAVMANPEKNATPKSMGSISPIPAPSINLSSFV